MSVFVPGLGRVALYADLVTLARLLAGLVERERFRWPRGEPCLRLCLLQDWSLLVAPIASYTASQCLEFSAMARDFRQSRRLQANAHLLNLG